MLERNNSSRTDEGKSVRPGATIELNEDGHIKAAKESFSRNAAKIWNQAPASIKISRTLKLAKKP